MNPQAVIVTEAYRRIKHFPCQNQFLECSRFRLAKSTRNGSEKGGKMLIRKIYSWGIVCRRPQLSMETRKSRFFVFFCIYLKNRYSKPFKTLPLQIENRKGFPTMWLWVLISSKWMEIFASEVQFFKKKLTLNQKAPKNDQNGAFKWVSILI